jgi:hypothetical protein
MKYDKQDQQGKAAFNERNITDKTSKDKFKKQATYPDGQSHLKAVLFY